MGTNNSTTPQDKNFLPRDTKSIKEQKRLGDVSVPKAVADTLEGIAYALGLAPDAIHYFPSAATALADPGALPQAGDWVAIWHGGKPFIYKLAMALPPKEVWGKHENFEGQIAFESITDGKIRFIPSSKVETVHKIVGTFDADGEYTPILSAQSVLEVN